MQKLFWGLIFFFLFFLELIAKEIPQIYVDKEGVMRREDTHREVSFFGINYTLPFAHAYRAMGYLDVDRKAAIDRDVYHFARLGFNAYRIHVWDVEISDREGNLVENDHLDLLDYLISKLKERNIHVLITTMTNFGNGYPEKNQPTDGFSYAYDKCDIHDNPEAVRAQQKYIASLVSHVNPYTGKAYKDDPLVVGFEINNEPCHGGTPEQTRDYIAKMVESVRATGTRKPLFYNASHNMEHVEAYYASDIQGTTFQWYPIGLVSGYTRKGNFLPYIDNFHIPFSDVRGFNNKAKLIYEYDPADILYSYMHPAMVRSFRTAGFQWITQFAYDPIDMAWANTEYQTHFLNLAYTPNKALSMKIAAEAAYSLPRGKSYGEFPADTLFGDFMVSYKSDLSLMNTTERYFHSNHTSIPPVNANALQSVAGYGSSPIVSYEGTGAYFIDRLEEGVWRLEVMPDAVQVKDPFAKPSLKEEVVTIVWNSWDMALRLPDLGEKFTVRGINEGNNYSVSTSNGVISSVQPGVYLLQIEGKKNASPWNGESRWNNISLGEYVAPQPRAKEFTVYHQSAPVAEVGTPLIVEALIAGPSQPDSVWIYTDRISFWSDNNPRYRMERIHGYTYRGVIPGEEVKEGGLRYNIVVAADEKTTTFPGGVKGSPLDWDHQSTSYWKTKTVNSKAGVVLFDAADKESRVETYTMPEWSHVEHTFFDNFPLDRSAQRFTFISDNNDPRFYLRSYVKEIIGARADRLKESDTLFLTVKEMPDTLLVGFVTSMGYTYTASVSSAGACKVGENMVVRVPLSEFQQSPTALLPHSYPVFLKKYFEPTIRIPFSPDEIEYLELSFSGQKNEKESLEISGVWLD